jgi:hypothetical protein
MSVQKHERTVVYTSFDRADAMGHGQALSRYLPSVYGGKGANVRK